MRRFIEWVMLAIAFLFVVAFYMSVARAQVPDEALRHQRLYTRIILSEWGVGAPVASFAAQIHQESGWNCAAVSRAGARGCAQFMPATARWIGEVDVDLAVERVHDPVWAFQAQAVYMRWLHDRVKADSACERLAFAMSAYNGGLGHVYKRQRLSPWPGRCLRVTCEINPGILPANQRENAEYPERILKKLAPRYAGWGPSAC